MQKRILILGTNRQSLTVMRSMGRAGLRVITGKVHGKASVQYSRYSTEVWEHPSVKTSEEEFVAALVRYLSERKDIVYVFPVGEAFLECLARHFEEIPSSVTLVMPPADTVLTCLDKSSFCRIASELEIPTSDTRLAHNLAELGVVSKDIGFPCIIKPNNSQTHFFNKKAIIAKTAEELQKHLTVWPEGNDYLIVQNYFEGDRHNCHFASLNGKLVGYFEHVTLRTTRIDMTGLTVVGITVRPNPRIRKYCEDLVERLNYSGVGCAQFLENPKNGQLCFLELNPRLAASCAFGYRWGLDFPKMALQCANHNGSTAVLSGQVADSYPLGKRMHWFFGDIEGLTEAIKAREIGFKESVSWFYRMVISFLCAHSHATWSWKDPVPTLFIHERLLVGVVWNRLKRLVPNFQGNAHFYRSDPADRSKPLNVTLAPKRPSSPDEIGV